MGCRQPRQHQRHAGQRFAHNVPPQPVRRRSDRDRQEHPHDLLPRNRSTVQITPDGANSLAAPAELSERLRRAEQDTLSGTSMPAPPAEPFRPRSEIGPAPMEFQAGRDTGGASRPSEAPTWRDKTPAAPARAADPAPSIQPAFQQPPSHSAPPDQAAAAPAAFQQSAAYSPPPGPAPAAQPVFQQAPSYSPPPDPTSTVQLPAYQPSAANATPREPSRTVQLNYQRATAPAPDLAPPAYSPPALEPSSPGYSPQAPEPAQEPTWRDSVPRTPRRQGRRYSLPSRARIARSDRAASPFDGPVRPAPVPSSPQAWEHATPPATSDWPEPPPAAPPALPQAAPAFPTPPFEPRQPEWRRPPPAAQPEWRQVGSAVPTPAYEPTAPEWRRQAPIAEPASPEWQQARAQVGARPV